MKFRFVIFLLVFLLPQIVLASGCSKDGYTISAINGIFTDEEGARNNQRLLKLVLKGEYKGEKLDYHYLLNPTHGPFGSFDLVDAVKQGLFDEKSDYDLIEMWNDASDKVATQKLLLVGHSQGNFYANNFFDLLANRTGGVPRKSLGVYAVATPASRVAGGGNYTTSSTDTVIKNLRWKNILNILPPNTHIDFQPSDDPKGHSFSDVYLKYQGARIVADIQSSLNRLQTNTTQNIYLPCINPPPVTFKHELQTNLLAIVDHPIDTTKQAVLTVANTLYRTSLAVGNTIIKMGKSLASKVKSLARNNSNSATVILSDLSTSQVDKSPVTNSAIAEFVTFKPATKTPTPNIATTQATSPYSIANNFPIPRDTEALPPYSIVNNFPIIASETTPPKDSLAPLLDKGGDGDGNSNYVHIEISHPNLLPGGGGVAAASLLVPVVPPPPPADTTAPVISITGTNPISVQAGSTYADAGATALDAVDGARTVATTGAVNTAVLGAYTITYTASDLSGNTATATRAVNVVDTTPPVISALTFTPSSGSRGVGGIVTLTITADGGNYTAGTITVNGVATTSFTNLGGNNYTATYTVVSGDTNRSSGAVPASVILTDSAGNSNVAYTTVAINTLAISTVIVLYDSRATYPYTPPPSQSGGNAGQLWNRVGGGAPSGGTVKSVNAVMVTKNAFNTSGTFQLQCWIDEGAGYFTRSISTTFNTNDYLTSSSLFDFAPYGADTWKFADVTLVNPFGNDCVYVAGEGVRVSITGSVLYVGNGNTSVLPQHRMVITN